MFKPNQFISSILGALLIFSIAAFISNNTLANNNGPKHKLVIQVSSDDARTHKIAINNAVNLQKHYGMDNIDIEIVAYGPGLKMLTAKKPLSQRIRSLVTQDIKFSACMNTMVKMKEKLGHLPKLTEGVSTVTAGVARIIELQEEGYAYIRP